MKLCVKALQCLTKLWVLSRGSSNMVRARRMLASVHGISLLYNQRPNFLLVEACEHLSLYTA